MKFSDYMKDNQITLLVCFAGGLFFLFSFWLLALVCQKWLCYGYALQSLSFYNVRIFSETAKTDSILVGNNGDLGQKIFNCGDCRQTRNRIRKIYFRLLKTALKSMTDEVTEIRRLKVEYKDFMEQWIHEIKVPITGVQLLCENNKTEIMRKIIAQTELMEQSIEKVLFYARLGNVEKDYLIKEISLKQCVLEVLSRNKQFLIHNRVCVHTDSISDFVYSDSKWLGFIINQIIFNSIKYCSDKPPVIQIKSKDMGIMLPCLLQTMA